MSDAIDRRAFLGLAGRVVIGSIVIYGAPSLVLRRLWEPPAAEAGGAPRGYQPGKHQWVFIVDTTRCIGCGRCVRACKEENHVPMDPDYNRTWIERYVQTTDGEWHVDSPDAGINGFNSWEATRALEGMDITKSFFLPKLCNQCEKPPCVQVCPVAATFKKIGRASCRERVFRSV